MFVDHFIKLISDLGKNDLKYSFSLLYNDSVSQSHATSRNN